MCQCQIFGTLNTENGALSDVLNVSNVCNMLQYRLKFKMVQTSITKYILLFYSRFLSPHHRYLSLSVFSSLCSLSSLSSLFIFHSTPITKGHHLTPLISLKTTTRHRRSSVFSIPLRVLFFFFLFSFFRSHFLVVGWAMGGFGCADQWWVGLGCGLWRWVG